MQAAPIAPRIASVSRALSPPVALREWRATLTKAAALAATERRYAYAPRGQALSTQREDLEAWLLACALQAHPAHELPFADLLRLPELFPFRLTIGVGALRRHPFFAVQRQGVGLDMVGLAPPGSATADAAG